MPLWLRIVLLVLLVIVVILGLLYYFGLKMQRKQMAQREQLQAMAQTVSMLVIDQKMMKVRDANFPKMIMDQIPKRMMRAKAPVVKAKIGNRIMTLMADPSIFDQLPVKTECKVVLSGIYITSIKSVRGGVVPTAPKKKGFMSRLRAKANQANATVEAEASTKKSKKG